jgi:hypothetical protein
MTTTYTITEAARILGIPADQLLDFDQSVTDGWDHKFTPVEVDELRHVLDNLDEFGAYAADA